jgi:hypothetical protein
MARQQKRLGTLPDLMSLRASNCLIPSMIPATLSGASPHHFPPDLIPVRQQPRRRRRGLRRLTAKKRILLRRRRLPNYCHRCRRRCWCLHRVKLLPQSWDRRVPFEPGNEIRITFIRRSIWELEIKYANSEPFFSVIRSAIASAYHHPLISSFFFT